MTKKNFASMILGTIGGVLFAIIVGLVGIVLLLALIPLCKGLKD